MITKQTEKNELTKGMHTTIKTLGALKAADYTPKTIKNELRDNLIAALKSGEQIFPQVHGY